jgi:uncharacterized protein YciI
MEFLYKTTAARLGMVTEGPSEHEKEIVNRHFSYLKSLTEQGTVLLFGRTQNSDATTFGIVIFRADSEKEAQLIMSGDPAVKEGVMRADLYPYKVAGLSTRDWPTD